MMLNKVISGSRVCIRSGCGDTVVSINSQGHVVTHDDRDFKMNGITQEKGMGPPFKLPVICKENRHTNLKLLCIGWQDRWVRFVPVMIRRLKSILSSAEVTETKGTQAGSKETPSTEYLLKTKSPFISIQQFKYRKKVSFKVNQTYFS